MNLAKGILLFFLLPFLAVISYPPDTLAEGLPVIGAALLLFVFLGILVIRGRSAALTLSILIQGLNVIIRLMMFFSNAMPAGASQFDVVYIVTNLSGLALSLYLLLRMDQGDVRVTMVA